MCPRARFNQSIQSKKSVICFITWSIHITAHSCLNKYGVGAQTQRHFRLSHMTTCGSQQGLGVVRRARWLRPRWSRTCPLQGATARWIIRGTCLGGASAVGDKCSVSMKGSLSLCHLAPSQATWYGNTFPAIYCNQSVLAGSSIMPWLLQMSAVMLILWCHYCMPMHELLASGPA